MRIGDTVILQKAGDVIPDIVSVVKEMRTGKEKIFKFPEFVDGCGGDGRIERVPGQAAYKCVILDSEELQKRKLYHFVSKKCFNIDGLGPKIIDALMDNGLIATFDDIFTLKKGDLLALPRFAEKSVDNLLETFEKGRNVTQARLIAALSIPQVGEETAIDIAKHIPDIEKASFEQLQSIYGVGDVVARSVVEWFAVKKNKDLYHRLLKQITITKEKTNSLLAGKTFVLTGTISMPRDEAQARIRALGGDVSSSVSAKTSFVVAGENAGSKLDKAVELDVPV